MIGEHYISTGIGLKHGGEDGWAATLKFQDAGFCDDDVATEAISTEGALLAGPQRYNVLLLGIPEISDRVLTERLRELERGGLLQRLVDLGPLAGSDGEELPWGPNQWGRDELTVNQALALLGSETVPEPPPLVPPLEPLSDLDWVRKASGDTGVHVGIHGVARVGENVVATDGKRLHRAPALDMREGHWNPETGEAIEAPFPKIDHLFPAGPPNVALDLGAAWDVIREAGEKGHYVSIPTRSGRAWFDARFLADALIGAIAESGPTRVELLVRDPLDPLRLTFPRTSRAALLMPVRTKGAVPGEHRLAAFVRPIEVPA